MGHGDAATNAGAADILAVEHRLQPGGGVGDVGVGRNRRAQREQRVTFARRAGQVQHPFRCQVGAQVGETGEHGRPQRVSAPRIR